MLDKRLTLKCAHATSAGSLCGLLIDRFIGLASDSKLIKRLDELVNVLDVFSKKASERNSYFKCERFLYLTPIVKACEVFTALAARDASGQGKVPRGVEAGRALRTPYNVPS